MLQITGFMFLTFLSCLEAKRQVRDVNSLIETYQFNKFLLSTAPKPFQIVYPRQVKKKGLDAISTKERQISHHGTYEHSQQVTFQIVIDRKKHKLKLDRNDGLLSKGVKVKHFEDERRQVITQTVEHCYYHGTIKRDDWSAAAVSTCNGISGIIQISNETYVIQPLEGGSEGMDHPHLVYKATSSKKEKCGNDHGKWLPFHELHKGEFLRKLKFLNAQRVIKNMCARVHCGVLIEEKKHSCRIRDSWFPGGSNMFCCLKGYKYRYKECWKGQGADSFHLKSRRETPEEMTDKFLKLALVLDNSMCWALNLSISYMTQYAIQMANIVDLYYKELNIRMALTYIELWNKRNRISVSPKLRETLENFLKFQQKHLRDIDHHAAHLLTSVDFEDETVGMAIPDSVCTDRANGISKMPNFLEPQQGATILSHMLGHNLGIKHDEDSGCECNDEFGCIMSTEVLDTPERHSRMFSSCSVADWDVSLNLGIAACLNENPQPTFPQVCGNKHLERGEECDCGTPEDCAQTDPCCDPSTCLLKYWAQCRSGACCHNCTYLSQDYLCRPQSTDCDVPEFCTGQSGQCPPNNYAKDGHPCSNNTGYCVGGICPTLDKQCQNIWGKDAARADVQCFERFNPTGNFNGHCGKDEKTGSFAKCLPDNIQCGLLHCAGGNKVPFYGPDKDSSKTTVFSNGQEYECKIVHGPSTMALPHMGLVQDGTKCGEGLTCMNKNCVPITTLPPLNCPGTVDGLICSGHGVCTKDDKCFCDDGWGTADCSIKLNITRIVMSIETITMQTTTITTKDPIKVIHWDTTNTVLPVTSTGVESSAVVQADDGFLNTKWMMIILAAVVGGLALLLGFSFLCYRRRSPGKLGNDKKKKKKLKHMEEGEEESSNKLIKFGSLPSYKKDKKKKKGKKSKNRGRSEDDSDIELPPPPVIISDPNSAKPEKGILKSPFSAVKYANDRRSSESNTVTSEYGDRESIDPYDEIDDDTEAGEIQDILSGTQDEHENNLDKLDSLVESSSFELMLPPPFNNMGLLNRSPSPPRRFNGYDLPITNLPQRPNMWKSSLGSPPRSRALKMKNLGEIFQHIDRHTIDLSPSPDDPPVQISPSTSEDVRSSSTEDRHYPGGCFDLQSPNSITSGSTCTALRPFLGSQWSKYVLPSQRNNTDNMNQFSYDMDSPLPHINIPPPMHPLNIRSIFNYGQKNLNRDNNDTPMGSQNGECSSNNGTANSRNGYEKSSGYGSEHDPERFSIEDVSRNQSRSGSASPPNFSAVIRTGPHQIKLVPASKLRDAQAGTYIGGEEFHKVLDDMPRIDAGCYERSPLSTLSSNVNSVTSTLETLKNSVPEYSSMEFTSTNTLVNSENDTLEKRSSDSSDKSSRQTEHSATNTLEMLKRAIPELADGPLPNPKPLCDIDQETGSAPCIDRSLEEISQLDNQKNGKKHRNSLTKSQRPVSLSVFKKQNSSECENDEDLFMGKRYSAIDPVPVEICEC